MTALAADRNTPRREGVGYSFPVAASVTCYGGAIAVISAAGYVQPATTATGLKCVGRFMEKVANGATAGAVTAIVEPGIFRYENSASTDLIARADIGADCYLVDDQTVAKTNGSSTRSVAGKIVDVDSQGVWVRLGY